MPIFGLWQSPGTVVSAWQPPLLSPPLLPPLPPPPAAAPHPEARIFLFFEYLTVRGQKIPGLAINSQCCGIENDGTRIVGGSDARENQYPWIVSTKPGTNTPESSVSLIPCTLACIGNYIRISIRYTVCTHSDLVYVSR